MPHKNVDKVIAEFVSPDYKGMVYAAAKQDSTSLHGYSQGELEGCLSELSDIMEQVSDMANEVLAVINGKVKSCSVFTKE
jgi:hypothetical protein